MARSRSSTSASRRTSTRGPRDRLDHSPTITTPAMTLMGVDPWHGGIHVTRAGTRHAVDKRTDIWAFGVVLYEMLTRKRAFEGEDVSLTLAAVMKSDPDLKALPPDVPSSVAYAWNAVCKRIPAALARHWRRRGWCSTARSTCRHVRASRRAPTSRCGVALAPAAAAIIATLTDGQSRRGIDRRPPDAPSDRIRASQPPLRR